MHTGKTSGNGDLGYTPNSISHMEHAYSDWCMGETCHDLYCVESNPLQQGWFVPHDIYGFIDLLGHQTFTDKLTAFFDK